MLLGVSSNRYCVCVHVCTDPKKTWKKIQYTSFLIEKHTGAINILMKIVTFERIGSIFRFLNDKSLSSRTLTNIPQKQCFMKHTLGKCLLVINTTSTVGLKAGSYQVFHSFMCQICIQPLLRVRALLMLKVPWCSDSCDPDTQTFSLVGDTPSKHKRTVLWSRLLKEHRGGETNPGKEVGFVKQVFLAPAMDF